MKLTLKQIRTGLVIAGLMVFSGWTGWSIGIRHQVQIAGKPGVSLNLFWQVWDKLEETYLIKADLKPKEMVWGAIRGMTQALGDPYTVFLPPEENKASKEELDGAFEGVGIELGFKDKTLAVIAPLAGMPAEAAGVKAGDYILHLKDEAKGIDQDTTEMSLPEAVKIIRGPKNSEIELTILHEGAKESAVIKVKRDTIVIKSVALSWVGSSQNLAHLKLSRFGGRTEVEWNEAVEEILSRPTVKGIILDLRNNPGGYLNGAINYAGEFLSPGQVVVKQEEARSGTETYSVTKQGRLLNFNLVVLVNEGSASSSEILAGALRDHQRAKIVGDRTFGKGTIQEAIDLGEGAGLHITTAKWLLPNGDWVNETKGIKPEIEISDNQETSRDEQLEKAIEELL